MKKIFSLAALTALLFSSIQLSAQTTLEWAQHGVGFTVPDDFSVITNNGDEFTATNDYLYVTIAPIQDENVTEDNLALAVVQMAVEMQYDVVDEADAIEIDDFTGYYVKGTLEGAHAVVMALMDTESSTNLLVIIAYGDGYEDQAIKIAGSFYAFD
jgi:hypothetical protein